jgi:hypothetical protein
METIAGTLACERSGMRKKELALRRAEEKYLRSIASKGELADTSNERWLEDLLRFREHGKNSRFQIDE